MEFIAFLMCLLLVINIANLILLFLVGSFLVRFADSFKRKKKVKEPTPQSGLVDVPTVGTYDDRYEV